MLNIDKFSGHVYFTSGNTKISDTGEVFVRTGNNYVSENGDFIKKVSNGYMNLSTGISSTFGDPFGDDDE